MAVSPRCRRYYRRLRTLLGGYDRAEPDSCLPTYSDHGRGRVRIYCGFPDRTTQAEKSFRFRNSTLALAFEILWDDSSTGGVRSFSVRLTTESGASLMVHHDPKNAQWPHHPERRLQFCDLPDDVHNIPFLSWRLPLGDLAADKCLEYIVALASARAGSISA